MVDRLRADDLRRLRERVERDDDAVDRVAKDALGELQLGMTALPLGELGYRGTGSVAPYHLINVALNLVISGLLTADPGTGYSVDLTSTLSSAIWRDTTRAVTAASAFLLSTASRIW